MSTERLREAARALRERAEAATEGPWGWGGSGIASGDQIVARTDFTADFGLSREWLDANRHNGQYIATMHPGVGLALARAMSTAADAMELADVCMDCFHPTCLTVGELIPVADLILGDAP